MFVKVASLLRCLVVFAVFALSGCGNVALNRAEEDGKDLKKTPTARDLPITYGGFISGGDERQKIEGVCTANYGRNVLNCDIYNGR